MRESQFGRFSAVSKVVSPQSSNWANFSSILHAQQIFPRCVVEGLNIFKYILLLALERKREKGARRAKRETKTKKKGGK